MKTRSMFIATALAALLGLSAPAHADRDHGPPHWAARHRHHVHHHHHHHYHWPRYWPNQIRYRAYRHGYRDGFYDRHRHGYWAAAPCYYGPGGYGFNIWLDGIAASYWEAGPYCR